MKRIVLALFAVVALLFAAAPGVAAQEQDSTGPQTVVVHRVDASQATTELLALADSYQVSADQVSLTENGEDVAVQSVSTARRSGIPQELVVVIDTSQSMAQGGVFESVKDEVAAAILDLPSNTSVAVVVAGDIAAVPVPMTDDLSKAARAVNDMNLSTSSVMFNAINRASEEFTTGSTGPVARSVVVFSGTTDNRSALTVSQARTGLVQQGVQVISVRYAGGEAGLAEIVDATGGISLGASTPDEVASALESALAIASDRLVIQFAGSSDSTVRGDATLNIGSSTTAFSYPGGIVSDRALQLRPVEVIEPGGIAFFRTQTGLFVALGLVFVSVCLAVFSLGSLFAGGESALEGLLSRYAGDGDGAALDEEESAIVQTALVKKAVEISESFAEERGFLIKVEELLERAKLPLRAGEAMGIFALGILFSSVVGFFLFGGFIGGLILAGITGMLMMFAVNFIARRRMRKFEQQLPDTLQLLAGTLRAGYSLPQGLEAVSREIADPMGYELRRVMTEARLGREIEDALGATAERLNSPDFAWAVMAIAIQREVGGNLNELLMTVSDTMIARERLKGEVAALTAEGKMSAILLGGLPPGLGLIMWLMNPDYINQLFVTTLGNIFVGLAVVSSLIGFAWMKKVITINV